jgi:capsular polysaccharide transport system permease protein
MKLQEIEVQGRARGVGIAPKDARRDLANAILSAPLALHAYARARLGLLGYSFVVFVIVPAFVTFLYLAIFASDEYVSEARFAVRSASETRPSAITDALTMLSSVTGVRSTSQDAFIVADYIRSRTVIEDLGGKPVLQKLYSKSSIDRISRLRADETIEDMWEYWLGKVTALIDTQSTILTLRVRAYTPQEAKELCESIVQRSEALVNEISLRSRRDALSRAETEVQLSLQRLAEIRQAMLAFRNKSSTIDPVSSAASLGETLTQLTREKILLESNRASLKGSLNENSPVIRFLTSQIESIDKQIALLRGQLTGDNKEANTISGQIASYEDLQLQSQFAEKLFEISKSGFEKARAEQDKQQLYLVNVVHPTFPEEASYPRPFTGTAIIFALCGVIWSMVCLVIASIEDHIG